MNTVRSKDGTLIAYDKTGQGPAVIMVGGAFSYRKFPGTLELAEMLSKHFTVYNYDRRGRGDSGDTKPYDVAREIEDIDALIGAAGGSAFAFGLSSGAALALRAAAAGSAITKLALYEPPFNVDAKNKQPPADFVARVEALVAADQRAEAVKYFMAKGMGIPGIVVLVMRLFPFWKNLITVAHTIPYDVAVMGETIFGKALNHKPWGAVTTPTLVIGGEKSPLPLRQAVPALVGVLPNGRQHILKGQSHNVSMKALAPVIIEFFKTLTQEKA